MEADWVSVEEKDYLHKRGNIWRHMRRVPAEFAELDNRGTVRKTHASALRPRQQLLHTK